MEMRRTQSDHVRLDLLSLVIWSRAFDHLSSETYEKHSVFSKSVLTIDRCRPHSVTFGYCGGQEEPAVQISWLLLHLRRVYVARTRLDFH